MASDNEDDPCKKRIKLNTSESDDVRTLNGLFSKIDNLEHFPLKVLLHIFTYVDDIDLLNLATKSYRFEGIAKMVLNERYKNKYYFVDGDVDTDDCDTYTDFFERFGKEIKSIQTGISELNDDDHWIISVLDKASNLDQLILDIFEIGSNEQFLQQHVNLGITHLTINVHTCVDSWKGFALPDFRNLKQLAIGNYPVLPFESFKQLIRNNPGLESLRLGERLGHVLSNEVIEFYPFGEVMEQIGTYLKQLKDFGYVPGHSWASSESTRSAPDCVMDNFVNSLQHLESLTLSTKVFMDFDVLLRRLGVGRTKIKHLELFDGFRNDGRLLQAIQSFENLKTLKLNGLIFSLNEIESLVEHLPFLCDFKFDDFQGLDSSFILRLLKKSPSLENIIVLIRTFRCDLTHFRNTQFFDDFIEIANERNVKIQLKRYDCTICTITINGVILK